MTAGKKKILIISAAAVVLLLGFAAYYVLSLYRGLESLSKPPESSPFKAVSTEDLKVAAPPEWKGTEPVNILLMGVDARDAEDDDVPRSDSMLVVSLDPVKKSVHLLSILRDVYTEIPGHGKGRINTAITYGPNTAMQAVSDLLGVPVQYYMYTDFQGFIKLVDAVGGVDFYVEKDMYYPSEADKHQYDIDLKKGEQHLNGDAALQYVRFRHDAMSDYSRTERQREFLKALSEKVKSTTSIMKLPDILNQVAPFIDTNLSVDDMWKLASASYQSTLESTEQIPPMNLINETYVGRAAVLKVKNENELKEYVRRKLDNPDSEKPENKEKVEAAETDGTGTAN
ncbi:LCP family protein [Saccharibacillus alkalitolerans]|uniref:LCP family protein n=1 Tax=Saccharibacillus alkalitolerans TaxID=2705290 RepID=A0ABX0F592_9BACL|nr:LCP family protein [Saccharibacillus alkalitolerans]NGZ75139.1 LCP family protein [Saccharibacillus alkalitolerans]